jgi:DNA-binding LytR/AlgR family response regulator
MIKIDRETPDLICIQLPILERQDFLNKLRSLLESGTTITLEAIGGIIRFVLSETDFLIDASQESEITLILKYDDCVDLAEAIQEHIEEDTDLPLDHSFETFGAQLVPESLEDVVFETI